MAIDGNWILVLTTPMGDRNSFLNLKSAGATLTGTQGDDSHSGEIFDGTISGTDVAWKITVTDPIELTLEFQGTVADDAITGLMGLGPLGKFPFTGKRT